MDQTEWLHCDRARVLLAQLIHASRRKLRLFACACCRLLPELTHSALAADFLDQAERCSTGLFDLPVLRKRWEKTSTKVESSVVQRALSLVVSAQSPGWVAWHSVVQVVALVEKGTEQMRQQCVCPSRREERRARGRSKQQRRMHLCNLLRDIFHCPPRKPPVLDPAVLAWRQGLVPRMARMIHDERRYEEVPILGDALEEAGCTDADVLAHARAPGPHVPGCWLVDSLTENS